MLLELAAVLIVAKLAAELCERVNVPAVVGEIVAGIIIGPSLLGWIPAHSEPIIVLAELGVLLLLLQVGMEMDLAELGRVGRASMTVALIGVAVPFVLGGFVAVGFGEAGDTSLFIGAALTATSVGITARVFGDLRALATTEARVVLGAAVADDVLGLLILTIVVSAVTGGDVDAWSITGTVGGAIGFLIVATAIGVLAAPAALRAVERWSRSSATIVVVAVAFVLALSWAADWASLAPIIGAFVAGLAIGRSDQHARVERELGSVGNLLIPVFFVQIGVAADVEAMIRPAVIGLAAALLFVGVVGKLASAWGTAGLAVDRLLVGIGMIPRGEVGIIFASIGLAEGILGDDQYAALLIVILVSTLITPPLLRWRVAGLRTTLDASVDDDGDTEWEVAVVGDRIVLRGNPPTRMIVPLALDVARRAAVATPDGTVISWFGARTGADIEWRAEDTDGLVAVLRAGDARSLRFLDVTGVLDRSLPEVGEALARRRADPGELDPTRILQLPTVQRIAEQADRTTLLGALVADVCTSGSPGCVDALANRLDPVAAPGIVDAVHGAALLDGALTNPDSLGESSILQLAEHFGGAASVDAAHELATARLDDDDWQRKELDEIRDRLLTALSHPELLDGATTVVDARRRAALQTLGPESTVARQRLDRASPMFLISHNPAELARQASLVGVRPRRGVVRVVVDELADTGTYRIDVSCRDRPGLLTRLTDAIAGADLDVVAASLTTWPDGAVLDSFVVRGDGRPNAGRLTERMERRLRGKIDLASLADVEVTFDDSVFPWHTQCLVRGPDRRGLLAAIAAAFDAAKVDVHAATVGSDVEHFVENRFQLTDRHGRKLGERARAAVLAAFGRAN